MMFNWGDSRLPVRFWDKVQPCPMSGCWLWTGAQASCDYGCLYDSETRKKVAAHRMSWSRLCGPIPAGHDIDHLCRVHCCVNPAHLEPVPHRENVLRGASGSKTHCPAGHAYSDDNTYLVQGGRARACKTCQRAYSGSERVLAMRRARKRAKKESQC